MSTIPQKFIDNLRAALGKERADSVLDAIETEASVSVRMNPMKCWRVVSSGELPYPEDGSLPLKGKIGWASDAYELSSRPSFTLDPLFQAGVYYVQEASSMYLELVEKYLPESGPLRALDLCAAPGGKTTHLHSILRRRNPGSLLVSNEVIRSRAGILAENIARWGATDIAVTNNDPSDFGDFSGFFDLLVVDAPCSGEGMFRKDHNARSEWSEENVNLCAQRQRRILSDIWHVLKDDAVLVYSTCTFNTVENDDNSAWICSELGAELLESKHCYPSSDTPGEGFYIAVFRKVSDSVRDVCRLKAPKNVTSVKPEVLYLGRDFEYVVRGELLKAYPRHLYQELLYVEKNLRCIHSGVLCATVKGEGKRTVFVPETSLALCEALDETNFHSVELYGYGAEGSDSQALKFFRKENLEFRDEPEGYLLLKYRGVPVGFVKNLGKRVNNLWPSNWRVMK